MAASLDYADIAKCAGAHWLVGVGESTHGTHEFFETKAAMFKLLVQKHGFNTFFFEAIDDHCEDINTYVRTGKGDLNKLVNRLFYVWRTHEVLALFAWMRANYEKHPITIVGLDERKYVDDYSDDYSLEKMNMRDKRMALVIKRYLTDYSEAKGMIWAHDTHVAAYGNAPLSYKEQIAPMGRHLRRWYKKDYYNIAQLFGSGTFSAALVEESGESDNRVLATHTVPETSQGFWEYRLFERYSKPVFLEGPTFDGLAQPHEIHEKRSLGWGVMHSAINDAYTWIDLHHAFNALVFFPHATASNPLV